MAAMFGKKPASRNMRNSKELEESLDEMRTMGNGETFEQSALDFAKRVQEAEAEGKGWIANEHWFNVLKPEYVVDAIRGDIQGHETFGKNPTWIQDDIFERLTPIILIRHPALSVRSTHRDALKLTKQRIGDENFDKITENKTLRYLFDYFDAQGRRPIVVDGEDLLWRTDEVRNVLCGKLRIDPDGLKDRWTKTSEEEIGKMIPLVYTMTKTIHDSEGIERPETKPEEPSIQRMVDWWTEQYGEEEARKLEVIAGKNMPHYEYLSQFKV